MKKIILYSILVILLLFISVFSWRVIHYYRIVKSGGVVDLGAPIHFSKSAKAGATKISNAVDVSSSNSPALGNADAKLKLVEFADFTCPYSKEEFGVVRELLAKYSDKVYLQFRFFPLGDEAHIGGEEAAKAAFCAQAQGKFWAYHDKLFLNQKNFTSDDLRQMALQTGLNIVQFESCINSPAAAQAVQKDYMAGYQAGIQGTPTFFVNGQMVEGAIPLEEWERLVLGVK